MRVCVCGQKIAVSHLTFMWQRFSVEVLICKRVKGDDAAAPLGAGRLVWQRNQKQETLVWQRIQNQEKQLKFPPRKRLKLVLPLRFCSSRLFTIKGHKMGLKLLKCAVVNRPWLQVCVCVRGD